MRVTPGAGGVVEDLVGEEVLIGVGEGGVAGVVDIVVVAVVDVIDVIDVIDVVDVVVVEAKGIDLDVGGGIGGVISEAIEGRIEIILHRLPLPLALIVFEIVRLAVVVVEES